MKLLAETLPLLHKQGIRILLPPPGELIDASIAIAPPPGSPERVLYEEALNDFDGIVISERDPVKALGLALAWPKSAFRRTIAGIDPGRRCGVTVVADDIIVQAYKHPCTSIGRRLATFMEQVPTQAFNIYLGDGPGFAEAAASLAASNLEFAVVDEWGTTKRSLRRGIASYIRDRDLLASLAIALRGAYGGKGLPQ